MNGWLRLPAFLFFLFAAACSTPHPDPAPIRRGQAIVVLPGGSGTASEAALAVRYQRPTILFGPVREFRRFPEQLERTDSLERVCDWLLATVR